MPTLDEIEAGVTEEPQRQAEQVAEQQAAEQQKRQLQEYPAAPKPPPMATERIRPAAEVPTGEVPVGGGLYPSGKETPVINPTPATYQGGIQPAGDEVIGKGDQELKFAPRQHLDYELPRWDEIEADPRYQKASENQKVKFLDGYAAQAKVAGREEAVRYGEDIREYDKGVDDFYDRKLKEIKPLSGLGDMDFKPEREATGAFINKATDIVAGIPRLFDRSMDLSNIGKMSIPEAKDELANLEDDKSAIAKSKKANEYLATLQEAMQPGYMGPPPEYPGGYTQALQDTNYAEGVVKERDALQKYIDSKGTVVPIKPGAAQFAEDVEGYERRLVKRMGLQDDAYERAHPLVKKATDLIGTAGAYIGIGAAGGEIGELAGGIAGATAAARTAKVTQYTLEQLAGMSDAFKGGYESGIAKADDMERRGIRPFTLAEKEQFAEDNASKQAWGTGSFYAVSGFILSRSIEGFEALNPEAQDALRQNLKQRLLSGIKTSALDITGQVGLQAGAQIVSNLIEAGSDSDDNKTPWHRGVAEAALTGLGFGMVGTGTRIVGTMRNWHEQQQEINRQSWEVESVAKSLAQDAAKAGQPMTNEDALSAAIDNKVAPEWRDKVRAAIAKRNAAQNEKNVADQNRDIAPRVSQALDQTSQETEQSTVNTKTSVSDEFDRMRAEMEAEEAKAAPPAAPPAVPPGPPKAPPPPRRGEEEPEEPEEEPTAGPPSAEEVDAARRKTEATQQQIRAKLAQLVDLHKDDKKPLLAHTIGNQWLSDNVHLKEHKDDHRFFRQVAHEADALHPSGATNVTIPERAWVKNTPEELNIARDNFNDYLNKRIAEKQRLEAGKTAIDQAAGAIPPEAMPKTQLEEEAQAREKAQPAAIPPDVMEQALRENNPGLITDQMAQGKQIKLNEEQFDKYEAFLAEHGLLAGTHFDEKTGNFFTPETDVVELHANKPEYTEAINALPAGPHENQHLKDAWEYLNSDATHDYYITGGVAPLLSGADTVHADDLKIAALRNFQMQLRKYGKAMADGGVADQIKPDLRDSPERAPDGTARPNPKIQLDSQAKQLGRMLRAQKRVQKGQLVSFEAPAGEGGRTQAELIADQQQKAEEELAKAVHPEAAEITETPGEEKAAATIDKGEWEDIGKEASARLAELHKNDPNPNKYDRAVHYYIKNWLSDYEVPAGTKSFRGITRPEIEHAAAAIKTILYERGYGTLTPRGEGENKPVGGPGEKPPGAPDHGKAGAGQPPPTETHGGTVLREPELPGGQAGKPPEAAGRREPGREEAGQAPAGQPGELLQPPGTAEGGAAGARGGAPEQLPPAGGPSGGGAEAPTAEAGAGGAAPGGKRTGAAKPAKRKPTTAPPERTVEIREKGAGETGGPNPTGRGGATGIQPGARATEPGGAGLEADLTRGPYRVVISDDGTSYKIYKEGQLDPITSASSRNREDAIAKATDRLNQLGGTRESPEYLAALERARPYLQDALEKIWARDPEAKARYDRLEPHEKELFNRQILHDIQPEAEAKAPPAKSFAEELLERQARWAVQEVPGGFHALLDGKPLIGLMTDKPLVFDTEDEAREAADKASRGFYGGAKRPEEAAPKEAGALREKLEPLPTRGPEASPEKLAPLIEKAAKVYPEVARDIIDSLEHPEITDLSKNLAEQLSKLSRADAAKAVRDAAEYFNDEITPPERPEPKAPAPEPKAPPPEVPLNWALADQIVAAAKADPERGRRLGVADQQAGELVAKLQRLAGGAEVTPDQINDHLRRIGQVMGIVEAARAPGDSAGSGVVHSLVPGVTGMHGLGGYALDALRFLRNMQDPELVEFMRSVNAHQDKLNGLPIYQLNFPSAHVFYHDGQLWVTPSMLHSPDGPAAMAHVLQSAVAQEKIRNPQTPEDRRAFHHWNNLYEQFRRRLPADMRDKLGDSYIGEILNNFKGNDYEHLEDTHLSDEEKSWLPVLWAAHTPENFLTAAFNNGNFRHYLNGIRMDDGRSLMQGVHQWGKTVFGEHAFHYADRAHNYTANHPGMPTRFDPTVHDLSEAYPLTTSERLMHARIQKYGLNLGIKEALDRVAKFTDNHSFHLIAKALGAIVDKYPEIKIGLEQRLGSVLGGYNFVHDRVTINPHTDDAGIQHSIIHEVTHALTVGKIDAYEKGLTDLLTPQDKVLVQDLEDLRLKALQDKSTPEDIRVIASLNSKADREHALLELGRKDPAMLDRYYGLTDTKEFASELLSNGSFQKHLRGISAEAPHGNMLAKAFNWVKKLLGFREEDSVLSRGFDTVMTLASDGRRVMEADIHEAGLRAKDTMMMRENKLAKRFLEAQATRANFPAGARSVGEDRLGALLANFRHGSGVSQNLSDLEAPHTVTAPRTRGMIRATPELERMTDPRDVIDHLARSTGTNRYDTDALRRVLGHALGDGALSPRQFGDAHLALDEYDDQTFNRIAMPLGNEKDRDNWINRMLRKGKEFRFEGELPREVKEKLVEESQYQRQVTASKIKYALLNLDRAVRKQWGINYDRMNIVMPHVNEELAEFCRGNIPANPAWKPELVEALNDMRRDIAKNSRYIWANKLVPKDKLAEIKNNIGKYLPRSYELFNDPRWPERWASQQYRTAAEKEVDAWLVGKNRDDYAKAQGEEARQAALRGYTDPNDPAARAAGHAAYMAAKAKAMKTTGTNFIDQKLEDWRQIAQNKQTNFMKYGHAYAISDKLMKDLSSLPKSLRDLMGEHHDLRQLYQNGMWKQQAFISGVNIARGIYDLGLRGGYISPERTVTCSTEIPRDFTHLGKLRGAYTKPEIAGALLNYHQNLTNFNPGGLGGLIRGLESHTRWMNTIGNLPRSMGNFHSIITQPLANGYWFSPAGGAGMGFKRAGQILWSDLVRMGDKNAQAYLEKMIGLGLGDKETNIHDIMGFTDHISKSGKVPLDWTEAFNLYHRYKHGLPSAKEGAPGQRTKTGDIISAGVSGLERAGGWLTKLHTTGNFMSKVIQFEMEKNLQRWYNDGDVEHGRDTKWDEAKIEAEAARVVRDTNVSYSQVSPMIQRWRKNPLIGTFVSYAEQQMKAYAMNLVHGWQNLTSDNPRRRWNGAARLGGAFASLTIPFLAQKFSQMITGVNDDDDDNIRQMLPPWERNNSIFYLHSGDGRVTYWNMGYSNQQSNIYRAIHAILSAGNNPHGALGAALDSAGEIFKPYLSEGLFTGALIDVGRNQTAYGTQVYNPNLPPLNQGTQIGGYLWNRLMGGSLQHLTGRNLFGSLAGQEKVTPGGNVYNWYTGDLPEITGLNIHEMSFPERLNSILYGSKDSLDRAQQIFTSPVQRSSNPMTDDQISEAYQLSEEARRNAFRNLYDAINACRSNGMSRREVVTALKARRYSTKLVEDLMTGRYHPFIPSQGVLDNARRVGNYIPRSMFSSQAESEEEEE